MKLFREPMLRGDVSRSSALKTESSYEAVLQDVKAFLRRIRVDPKSVPPENRISENEVLYVIEGLLRENLSGDDRRVFLSEMFEKLIEVNDTRWADFVEDSEISVRSDLLRRLKALKRIGVTYYPRTQWQARCKTRFLDYLFGLQREAQLVREQRVNTSSEYIADDSMFTCIGSCFAVNLGLALRRRGVDRVAAIRYHDDTDPLEILMGILDSPQLRARLTSQRSQVVIITLGFAENRKRLDLNFNSRFGRLQNFLTPEAISGLLSETAKKLTSINPNTRIFATVSPVPMTGSASGFGSYDANSISKSIVRLGVALASEDCEIQIEYFPSYEIVTQAMTAMGVPYSGGEDGNPAHIDMGVIDVATGVFCEKYLPSIPVVAASSEKATIDIEIIKV